MWKNLISMFYIPIILACWSSTCTCEEFYIEKYIVGNW